MHGSLNDSIYTGLFLCNDCIWSQIIRITIFIIVPNFVQSLYRDRDMSFRNKGCPCICNKFQGILIAWGEQVGSSMGLHFDANSCIVPRRHDPWAQMLLSIENVFEAWWDAWCLNVKAKLLWLWLAVHLSQAEFCLQVQLASFCFDIFPPVWLCLHISSWCCLHANSDW